MNTGNKVSTTTNTNVNGAQKRVTMVNPSTLMAMGESKARQDNYNLTGSAKIMQPSNRDIFQ